MDSIKLRPRPLRQHLISPIAERFLYSRNPALQGRAVVFIRVAVGTSPRIRIWRRVCPVCRSSGNSGKGEAT